jgi:type I site-specific restriction endonuclease
VIVEAKKADLATGLGQCVAEMVAAQLFNQLNGKAIPVVYGVVSNGTQWRFLNLQDRTVTLDLVDYPLPPVDQLLGFLVWIMQEG